MRTDVKLGLAVGSILFSVVLVYVLFFASGVKPKTPTVPDNQVAATAPGTDAVAPGTSATPIPALPGTPEPMVSITPTTRPASAETPTISTLNIYTPATAAAPAGATPGESAAPGAPVAPATVASSGRSWESLLSNGNPGGELVARTETPMAGSVHERADSVVPGVPGSVAPVAPVVELAPSVPSTVAAERHVVKPGETLWSIAREAYGNAAYHSAIAKANPKINPNRLRAGEVVMLPPKSEFAAAVTPVVAASPTTQPVDLAKQYRVKANDNLNTICKRLYGNTARVAQLYQLNKNKIGPNPSALKLGMILDLPEAPASSGGNAAAAPASGATEVPPVVNPLAGTMQ